MRVLRNEWQNSRENGFKRNEGDIDDGKCRLFVLVRTIIMANICALDGHDAGMTP
jgi:hypothetical protein